MGKYKRMLKSTRSNYWKVFRIVFVIFSLYLTGDAFYRWDGFMYYGSFSDFLPGVALIIIIWSSAALIMALLLCLFGKFVELFFRLFTWKINVDYIMINVCLLMFLSIFMWFGKQAIFRNAPTPIILKLTIASSIILITLVMSWLLRNKMFLIQERITPLVWIYGILVFLSVPLLVYCVGHSDKSDNAPKKLTSISSEDTNRPNIILVTFDALTARKMSVYGYGRTTTPFINEWAKNASKFTMAQAESTYTSPTTASLMTGKRVWTHQLYQPHGYKVMNANIENLPLVLKKNGYYTIALIQNIYASVGTLDIAKSYDITYPVNEFVIFNSISGLIDVTLYKYFSQNIILYDWATRLDFLLGNLLDKLGRFFSNTAEKEYPLEKVFNKFLWLIKKKQPEPFFAWLHLMPPHDPYLPPDPYMGMFDASLKLRTFNDQTMKNKYAYIDITRARYDEFIRYCDNEFENFINESSKHISNTVIILSADHGESFEHNYIGHGERSLYEQLTNIPLIIKETDQTEGTVISDIVEQIDIAPTILELANISIPPWMEGQSLVPLMRGKKYLEKPALSMSVWSTPGGNRIKEGTFAIWEGDYKLIHYLKDNKSMLFDLKADPDEINNLYNVKPEVSSRLLTLIKENLEKANERIRLRE